MKRLVVECCGQTCELPAFLDMRGLLSFWLLWELRLGPLRGAQLGERLTWRRGNPLSPGTLYPALESLEQNALVRKHREGRDTVYDLTAKGQSELSCAQRFLRFMMGDVVAPPKRA